MDSAEGVSSPARERAASAPKAPYLRSAVMPRPKKGDGVVVGEIIPGERANTHTYTHTHK